MPSSDAIEFGNIRISAEKIAEMAGRRAVVTVNRADLVRAKLENGWLSNRPVVQLVFGIVLFAIGLVPILGIVVWLLKGGEFFVEVIGGIAMLFFGGWVIHDSRKRGFFLAVEGASLRNKLCFDRSAELAQIEQFLGVAETLYGYSFEKSDRTINQHG